jgi:hypothetical protein
MNLLVSNSASPEYWSSKMSFPLLPNFLDGTRCVVHGEYKHKQREKNVLQDLYLGLVVDLCELAVLFAAQ